MTARLRKLLGSLREKFWLLPGLMVVLGGVLAIGLLAVDRSGLLPPVLIKGGWLYDGGGTGARTLLGAVIASTIGVAGTVFSITIAALSLAAGQMGPRLLRNFTRDRGNQFTLGTFLGTFSYALMVLRSVRTHDEGSFVPHLSLSVGIVLAFVCVGTLVYFVGHMAGRINVDTVIALVGDDLRKAFGRLMVDEAQPAPPAAAFWHGARPVFDPRRGYLQELDADGLADWAAKAGAAVRLLVRPGGYVFPGAPIALLAGSAESAEKAGKAIRVASALGPQRVSSSDLEYAVRQLVEVAVRALSPGINDPHTAIGVVDRLGAALCDVESKQLPNGVFQRDGRIALMVPNVDYEGLCDAMFEEIRQAGAGHPAILLRMLEVLTAVARCERDADRLATLRRHATLVLGDAEREVKTPADLFDVRGRHAQFVAVVEHGRLAGTEASARAGA